MRDWVYLEEKRDVIRVEAEIVEIKMGVNIKYWEPTKNARSGHKGKLDRSEEKYRKSAHKRIRSKSK